MRRALSIYEVSYGAYHPKVAAPANNLALVLRETNRFDEAELLTLRALKIDEANLGPSHPTVANRLGSLAVLHEARGKWSDALPFYAKAKPILIASRNSAELTETGGLKAYARALFRARADDPASLAEGFELAQWALQNAAANGLSAMVARVSKGDGALAKVVREHESLLHAREEAYRRHDLAEGKADAKTVERARSEIAEIEVSIAQKQTQIGLEFPGYEELAHPKPLPLRETQSLLGDRQALILFLDLGGYAEIGEETIVFALTKREARWKSIPIGSRALIERVASLRCGLDNASSPAVCKALLSSDEISDLPAFDAAVAFSLYRALFGGIEDMVKDKSLLIVPSGALTHLPFEVLVNDKPDETVPRFEAYKKAAWLGQRQAISILPSVGSLKALQTAKASLATVPFIGFGNPLLDGIDGEDKSAWAKQECLNTLAHERIRTANHVGDVSPILRNGRATMEELRHQPPLPETADELCEIAQSLWITESGLDNAVYLGERATVSQVKALSRSGDLARARVVHFATHGLLAGETASFAKTKAEPALLLTPPAEASEEDNGLLTASEVAQLNLNADWVVMSACNTAAGSAEGGESLSGLARAFFYAGSRSLLVSHWYVDSEAAVAITTGAVNAMKVEPGIGHAEALRRAEVALIAKGGRFAHPSVWAPFVLVGNGEQ